MGVEIYSMLSWIYWNNQWMWWFALTYFSNGSCFWNKSSLNMTYYPFCTLLNLDLYSFHDDYISISESNFLEAFLCYTVFVQFLSKYVVIRKWYGNYCLFFFLFWKTLGNILSINISSHQWTKLIINRRMNN